MGGYRPVPNYQSAKEGHEDYYWGMGLTAEAVAQKYKVSREDQDAFSFGSHMKSLKAQEEGFFDPKKAMGLFGFFDRARVKKIRARARQATTTTNKKAATRNA